MAKVSYGDIIVNMRGSQGGTTYSANRAGNYKKTKAIPTYRNTAAQQFTRGNLGDIAAEWRGLTGPQRDAWIALAATIPLVNSLGHTYFASGFNTFLSCNTSLLFIGVAFITAAPVSAPIVPLTTFSVIYDASAQSAIATYTPTPTTAGQLMVVMASQQQSAGVNASRNILAKVAIGAAAEASPFTFTTGYLAKYPAALVTGAAVFTEAYMIDAATGFQSPVVRIKSIVQA
jgi:hypothetical protein